MSLETEQSVRQAVYALYSSDAVQQAQANQFLTSFQQSHEAWHVSFRLLAPDQPQELLFFAATLLVRKVKSDWGKLEPGQRQELNQAIRAKFQEVLSWPAAAPALVLRQLCLLLAAVAGSSGGEGASDLVTQAQALLGTSTGAAAAPTPQQALLGLELLTSLGEEAEDLDRVRRLALVTVLAPRAREVFGLLGRLLAQALEQPGEGAAQLAAAALKCTEAWLKLNQVAGGGSILTPGELHTQQPQLFAGVLSALVGAGRPPAVLDAAVQVLLLVFGAETFSGGDENAERAATAATLSALCTLRNRLAGASGEEGAAVGVTQLGSALAERAPEWCGGELPQAVPFSEVMLEALSRPEPAMAENSIDYFLMLNTVSLAERVPELRTPLYEHMLRGLVHHVSLPPHFTTWDEEGEVDQDTFYRLREQSLPESLETAYGLLRSVYLGFAWHLLQSAGSWQQAEAALYFFTAVSLNVKARVLSGPAADENGPSPDQASAQAQDAQHAHQLLTSLFVQLCSAEGMARMASSHPLLACGACSLLDSYAAWFSKAPEAPLQAAFQLVLACLGRAEASSAAAKAFQSLCLRCAWRLREPQAVAALIAAARPLLEQQQQLGAPNGAGLSMADKQLVVEGLARLVAGLPAPHLQDAAASLTQPFASQATALVQGSHPAGGSGTCTPNGSIHGGAAAPVPSPAARALLAEELQLVASALRFLAHGGAAAVEGGEGAPQLPVVRILEEAGSALQAVVEQPGWHGDERVAAAAAEVYRRAICSARKQGAALLPAVLPALMALFERTGLPGCLDAVSDAVEIHHQDAATAAALAQALGAACAAAFPRLQADLREQQALASSLLNLADQFAVYAPTQLWPSPLLQPLLQLASACVSLREADPVSHALALLSHCATAHDADEDSGVTQAHIAAVGSALGGCGEEVVRALLAAECNTCPRHLMRSAADCLFKLLTHPALGQAARGWLSAVLASGQLPGCASGQLSAEDCGTFCSIALGGGVRGPRFMALVVDFGQLARGQNTSDVLLAYQM